ncbi:hypothetical protein BD770DRAFT_410692 [Pilaira anomala]|nr:hypothetical protein BD770DRAFT_410692 [Pilaira anomala]
MCSFTTTVLSVNRNVCDSHSENNDDMLLDIFSLRTKIKFTATLKEIISKILRENKIFTLDHKELIHLNVICSCRVTLAIRDIIYISFKPILHEIASTISASLIDTNLFGKYSDIQSYMLKNISNLIFYFANTEIWKINNLEGLEPNGTLAWKRALDIPISGFLLDAELKNYEKVPIMASVEIENLSSSFKFTAKIVGQDKLENSFCKVGKPMRLARY